MLRVKLLSLVVVLGVVAAGCAGTDSLGEDVARQGSEIEALSVKVADQAALIDVLEGRLSATASAVASIDMPRDASGDLAELRDGVLSAISVARAAETSAEDAESAARDAYDRADDVASCVNDYMDVIGRWSSNVNSYFTWQYC